jgi:hypothetical protein
MPYYRPTHFYCRATTWCYFSYIDAYFSLCFADRSYIWTTSTTLAPPVTGYPPLASVSMTRSPFIVSLLVDRIHGIDGTETYGLLPVSLFLLFPNQLQLLFMHLRHMFFSLCSSRSGVALAMMLWT